MVGDGDVDEWVVEPICYVWVLDLYCGCKLTGVFLMHVGLKMSIECGVEVFFEFSEVPMGQLINIYFVNIHQKRKKKRKEKDIIYILVKHANHSRPNNQHD